MGTKKRIRITLTEKRIIREMAGIAFSEEEKTADRLRALDLLSELTAKEEQRESAMAKLDEVLALLDGAAEPAESGSWPNP